jgi:hypothetical protein
LAEIIAVAAEATNEEMASNFHFPASTSNALLG